MKQVGLPGLPHHGVIFIKLICRHEQPLHNRACLCSTQALFVFDIPYLSKPIRWHVIFTYQYQLLLFAAPVVKLAMIERLHNRRLLTIGIRRKIRNIRIYNRVWLYSNLSVVHFGVLKAL